jgi:hypothetical protein
MTKFGIGGVNVATMVAATFVTAANALLALVA